MLGKIFDAKNHKITDTSYYHETIASPLTNKATTSRGFALAEMNRLAKASKSDQKLARCICC